MRKSFKEEEKVASKWEKKDTYVYYFHYFIIFNVMKYNKSTKYS